MNKKKSILLVGSTGYIGKKVLETLLNSSYKVICIGRNIDPLKNRKTENLIYIKTNFFYSELKNLIKVCPKFDAVISCLGSRNGSKDDSWNVEYKANKIILDLAKLKNCQSFILLSAICVQKPKLTFQFAKIKFEETLMSSNINYCIIRPTAFFKSLSGQIENLKKGKPFLIFDGGEKTSCKPISERDLANFICKCLFNTKFINCILPIGGPGPSITPVQQGEIIFRLMKKKPKFKSYNSNIFKILNAFLYPFSLLNKKIDNYREFIKIGHFYATESMLVWDPIKNNYTASGTPEYGEDTIQEFYENVINSGTKAHDLGEHKMF